MWGPVRVVCSILMVSFLLAAEGLSSQWFTPPSIENVDSWDPYKEMQKMNERVNRMVNEFYSQHYRDINRRVNRLQEERSRDASVEELDDRYIVRLGIDNLDQSDINISAYDQILQIAAAQLRANQITTENADVVLNEYYASRSDFVRAIPLPANADLKKLTSQITKNVLSIQIPKIGYNNLYE